MINAPRNIDIPYHIDLPDGLEDVDKFGYVIDRINKCKLEKDNHVYLSIRNVSFISPYGLLGLLLLGKYIYQITEKKITIIDNNFHLMKYLERMDFFERGSEWFISPDLNDKFSRSEQTTSLLEIQKIGTIIDSGKRDVDNIVIKFRQRASRILANFHEKMDVNFFIKVMSEICTNVYTHSKSDGYVAIQRYKYKKTGFEVVKLAVVDYGIGIKNSLEPRNRYKFHNDSEYIKKALEPGVSGLGDRGFGLYEVKKIVKASAGYLWINSGDGAVLLRPEKQMKEYINMQSFRGTRIAIILSFGNIDFSLDNDTQHGLF